MSASAPRRTDAEARAILDAELSRIAAARAPLGRSGAHAVAGWALHHAYEWEAALLAWREVLAADGRDCEARLFEATCLIELSRFADAAARLRELLLLDRELVAAGEEGVNWMEDDPAYRLGVALHALGDLDGALVAYEESAARNTPGTDALREIVRCRIVRGEGRQALDAIERLERRTVRLSLRAEAQAFRAEARELLRER